MQWSRASVAIVTSLLVAVLPIVAAHGDDGHGMDMNMDTSNAVAGPGTASAEAAPLTYFRYAHYGGWMYAHVLLMIVAWAIVLPVALVLSVARSRYHLPLQVVFHILNGLGVFTGFVYNHSTPDLYYNNSHHPIGWIVTSCTMAWTFASLFVAYGEYKSKRRAAGGQTMTVQAVTQHNRLQRYSDYAASRYSRDSGHGSERNFGSLLGSRQSSQDSGYHEAQSPLSPTSEDGHVDDDADPEKHGLLGKNRVDRFISRNVRRCATPRASKVLRFNQIILEKILLLLGFFAITTGFVVWGGVFKGRGAFSGAAHFAKGGIFFWYGVLTLARWMGAFSEFGWAWNIRPSHPLVSRWKSRVPSAEFMESFVIWTYGASNVFLEHLNAWGKPWTHTDFEHISITLLFFGGGLLGMMIESSWTRELMNTTVVVQKINASEAAGDVEKELGLAPVSANQKLDDRRLWEQPDTYKVPLNPLPGLVILLLGIMMSGHHQESMVSTMMHAQWGTLFCGFAMARGVTYIILYIKPPTSHFPARPPSELIAAFCLTAGGLMFMLSAHGTVEAIEANGLDAMTVFTVTTGFSATILAWEVVVFAIKGWAVRKERAAAGRPLA